MLRCWVVWRWAHGLAPAPVRRALHHAHRVSRHHKIATIVCVVIGGGLPTLGHAYGAFGGSPWFMGGPTLKTEAPVKVPEPSTLGLGLAWVAVGYFLWRPPS